LESESDSLLLVEETLFESERLKGFFFWLFGKRKR
jgi:hypothetical protein